MIVKSDHKYYTVLSEDGDFYTLREIGDPDILGHLYVGEDDVILPIKDCEVNHELKKVSDGVYVAKKVVEFHGDINIGTTRPRADSIVVPDEEAECFTEADNTNPFVESVHKAVSAYDDWVPVLPSEKRLKSTIDRIEQQAIIDEDNKRFSRGESYKRSRHT